MEPDFVDYASRDYVSHWNEIALERLLRGFLRE